MVEAAGLSATAQIVIGAQDSIPPVVTPAPDSGIQDGETALVGTGQIKVNVSDAEGVASVTVNGVPATPDGQGNWVATVNVNKSANQFTVKAKDVNGNEKTETITAYGSSIIEMVINIETTQPYALLTDDGRTSNVKLNTVPEIYQGRTYVGFRDLGEKLFKGDVDYTTTSTGGVESVTITIPRSNGDVDELIAFIGQKDFRITRTSKDGTRIVEDFVLENPPYIGQTSTGSNPQNYGRTMVPMREFIEAVVGKRIEATGENSVDFNTNTRDATFRYLP